MRSERKIPEWRSRRELEDECARLYELVRKLKRLVLALKKKIEEREDDL